MSAQACIGLGTPCTPTEDTVWPFVVHAGAAVSVLQAGVVGVHCYTPFFVVLQCQIGADVKARAEVCACFGEEDVVELDCDVVVFAERGAFEVDAIGGDVRFGYGVAVEFARNKQRRCALLGCDVEAAGLLRAGDVEGDVAVAPHVALGIVCGNVLARGAVNTTPSASHSEEQHRREIGNEIHHNIVGSLLGGVGCDED